MANRSKPTNQQTNDNIFQPIAESMHSIVRLPVSIWIPDEDQEILHIQASVGLPKKYANEGILELDKQSVVGEVFKTGRKINVKNIQTDERWKYKTEAEENGWQSALCVPIKIYSTVVGVVSVYAYRTGEIKGLETPLKEYARQISLTIETNNRRKTIEQLLKIGNSFEKMVSKKPKIMLQEIVKRACFVTGADCAVIYPYNAEQDEFYDIENVASYGLKKPLELSNKPRQKKGMAAYVKQEGILALSDIGLEDPPMLESPFIKREEIKAFIGIALKMGKDTLGVLYIDFRHPQNFSNIEKETVQLFANQASTAISNVRLFQKSNLRIKTLETLHEVGTSLTSVSTNPKHLKNLLIKIAQNARTMLGADLVDLYQYDQNRNKYTLPPIQVGNRYDTSVPKTEIHEDDIILRIVKNRKPEYVVTSEKSEILNIPFTVKRSDAPQKRFVEREKIKSTAGVPLLVGEEIVGVLFASFRKSQSFSTQQKKTFELFASQAAIAIWNTRLYAEMQKRLDGRLKDISSFQEIYEKMYSTPEGELMSLIAAKAVQLTNAKYGVLWLADKDRTQLTCKGVAGDDRPASMLPKLFLDKTSINGWVMHTGKSYLCNNIEGDAHYRNWYKDARSELAVPLVHNKNVIGTLDVESTAIDNFTPDHIELLKTLATQAAVAIQNARTVKKLDTLDNFGRALTNTIRLREHEILKLVHENASKLMDTDNMYIALYDERTDEVRFGLAFVNGEEINIAENQDWHPRKAGKGKTETIIQNKEPIFHASQAEAKAWYAQPRHEEYIGTFLASWLGVPMIVGEKAIGVIATYHPTKNYVYSSDDLKILQSMAIQTAIALDNSTLFYGINQKLQALVDFEQKITSAIQFGEKSILDLVHENASKLMDTDNMYVAFYDEHTDQVRFGLAFVDGAKINIAENQGWYPRMAGKGKTEAIIRTKEPILHTTKAEAKAWYAQSGHKEYVGAVSSSWIGVPMIVGKKAIGVIATYHNTKNYVYSSDDLEILQSMANQTAVALESSRVIKELKGLQIISKILVSEKDLKKLLTKIVEIAIVILKADSATIYQYDEKEKEFYLPVIIGGKKQSVPSKNGVVAHIIQQKEIIFSKNAQEHALLKDSNYIRDTAIKSCAAIPLQYGAEVIGILFVNYIKSRHYFTDFDKTIIDIFVGQVAAAINMVGSLNNTNQQLETVLEVINAVEHHTNLRKFLQTILEKILERTASKNGTIQLYDSKRDGLIIWAQVGNVSNQAYQHLSIDSGITGKAAKEKAPVYVPDTRLSSDYLSYLSSTRSEYAVPMLLGDTLIGVLNIEDPEANAFSPYSRKLVFQLASQLAILIRQKQKAQEMEEKNLVDQVNKSMGLITAEVAHKVGNDAGKLRYYALSQLENENLSKEHRDVFQRIHKTVEDMIRATDDLFKPFGQEEKAEANVNEMVKVAISQCVIPDNINLHKNFSPNLPKVKVQVVKVQSYLAELIHNALKYAQKGIEEKKLALDLITVSTQQSDDGYIEILFTNHGPSIPANRWESIFKVFSARGHKSIDEQSYGLGLWGARAAMQEQDGTVLLQESDDVKTTFMVRLPPI